ncbi:MAG TPA: hypothetical protein HPP77_01655 [Candidatus Hydrogenedentes bacterium]|nr:hypothetical protein [Candidatus Hydrogenedentota bacterium]
MTKNHVLDVHDIHSSSSIESLNLIVLGTYAKDWCDDALRQALVSSKASDGAEAVARKRREIVFAVCAAESYLYEWVRDEVLKNKKDKIEQLHRYFPPDMRKGIRCRWKTILKGLATDQKIEAAPSFGGQNFHQFTVLVGYRNSFVHAGVSRPEQAGQKRESAPEPSHKELAELPHGWAIGAVLGIIRELHEAVGTEPPEWVKEASQKLDARASARNAK